MCKYVYINTNIYVYMYIYIYIYIYAYVRWPITHKLMVKRFVAEREETLLCIKDGLLLDNSEG